MQTTKFFGQATLSDITLLLISRVRNFVGYVARL